MMNYIMKILIYSTKDFEIPFLEKANNDRFQIKYVPERLTTKTASLAIGFDAVSIFSADDGSSQVLERLKGFGVRYITLRSAGYDNVNLKTAKKLGIRVANAAGYSPNAIAEHAITLLLTLNRKILDAHQQVHKNNFLLSNLVSNELYQKKVGVVGTGNIGSCIAKIMKGFGCTIIANDLYENENLVNAHGVRYTDLINLVQQSDVIFLCVPLTSNTHHLIDANVISQMKPNAILINVARGAVVNTIELIDALTSKKNMAYGADVYEYENGVFFYDHSNNSRIDELLQKLINLPNTLITPHQGFATTEALTTIAKMVFDNIDSWNVGKTPKNELCKEELNVGS